MVLFDIALILSIILVGGLLIRKHLKNVEINNDKVVNDVIRGETEISYLRTNNPEKQYVISYRDKTKGFQIATVQATNFIEAEALFCKENSVPSLRILSVKAKI